LLLLLQLLLLLLLLLLPLLLLSSSCSCSCSSSPPPAPPAPPLSPDPSPPLFLSPPSPYIIIGAIISILFLLWKLFYFWWIKSEIAYLAAILRASLRALPLDAIVLSFVSILVKVCV
jgi:hypothetical protein